MVDRVERMKLRWAVISAPRTAIEHDDKVSDWLALGACALAAFVVSNFSALTAHVSAVWCFLMVGLLAGSAVFGLLSRILAAQFLKIVSISDHVNALMNETNFKAVAHESNRVTSLLPCWYRGYQRWQTKMDMVPFRLEMRAVRLGLYQWVFSGLQKWLMLAFVVIGFSCAYQVLVEML